MGRKPRIAVDFDGFIHAYTSPWTKNWEINDGPIDGAIEWLEDVLASDIGVVIHTCRFTHQNPGNKTRILKSMVKWFETHGMDSEAVACLDFWWKEGKPHATMYLDDRGFRFVGRYPSPNEIKAFKPWKEGQPTVPEETKDSVLLDIVEMIEAFDKRTLAEEYTDTGEAWDLFNQFKDMAKRALGPLAEPEWFCTVCGGHDVQFIDWYDPNNGRHYDAGEPYLDKVGVGRHSGQGKTWCNDCDDDTPLKWTGN